LDDLPEQLRTKAPAVFLTNETDSASTSESLIVSSPPPLTPAPEPRYTASEIIPLEEMERRHILLALQALDNNQTEVAKRLGISRSTLWRKLQEHQIKLDS